MIKLIEIPHNLIDAVKQDGLIEQLDKEMQFLFVITTATKLLLDMRMRMMKAI